MLYVTRFDMNSLHEAAKEIMAEHGVRPGARVAGVSTGSLRHAVDAKDATISSAIALLEAVGLELTVGKKDHKFQQPNGFSETPEDFLAQANITDAALGKGYAPLKWHDHLKRPDHPFPIAVHLDWLKAEGWNLLELAGVVLDEPAAHYTSGTPLLVNMRETETHGAIVAWKGGGRVRLARFYKTGLGCSQLYPLDPGDPVILSDPNTPPKSNTVVLGRLIWAGLVCSRLVATK